ncbi:MAG: class I SAM-dependent DNA methyltransferase [Actinomycetota bacterium]
MDPDELRASYDRVAETYADTFFDELDRKPFDRELLDAYAERTRDQGLVLDVGCGPGHIARYLHERGVDAAGIDLSPEMVELARRLNPNLRFEVGDMAAPDFDDAAVAGIVAFYSVIHIAREGVPGVMREFRRVIRAGGELVVAVHAGTGSVHRDDFLGEPVPFEATFFERDELVSLVEGAGFRIEQAIQRAPYDTEAPTQRLYVRALVP